jgi:hypothetical protein
MVSRSAFVQTARAMAVDQVTAEVVPAFRAAGIGAVLLKGPAIAQWLYPEGGRYYGDVDLLVAPGDLGAAEAVLADLSFHSPSPAWRPQPAYVWRREGHPVAVDLHHSLRHVQATPPTVWEVLSADTVDITVAGITVPVLDLPGRAFHVALHAAQHGVAEPKPVEDLRRAVATLELAQWGLAASLARRLGAEDCMAAGLGMVAKGASLAARLELTGDIRLSVRLARASAGRARALQDLASAGSLGDKAALLHDVVLLPPASMRKLSPVARRGRAGLALAYAARPLRLVGRSPGALRTLRQVRSSGGAPGRPLVDQPDRIEEGRADG